MAAALASVNPRKRELEKESEFEARKRDAVASAKLGTFTLGRRDYLVFVAPQKRTWFRYDAEKQRFLRNPSAGESLLSGAVDVDVFDEGRIAHSQVIYETELQPTRAYEGTNSYGVSTTVYVG